MNALLSPCDATAWEKHTSVQSGWRGAVQFKTQCQLRIGWTITKIFSFRILEKQKRNTVRIPNEENLTSKATLRRMGREQNTFSQPADNCHRWSIVKSTSAADRRPLSWLEKDIKLNQFQKHSSYLKVFAQMSSQKRINFFNWIWFTNSLQDLGKMCPEF